MRKYSVSSPVVGTAEKLQLHSECSEESGVVCRPERSRRIPSSEDGLFTEFTLESFTEFTLERSEGFEDRLREGFRVTIQVLFWRPRILAMSQGGINIRMIFGFFLYAHSK